MKTLSPYRVAFITGQSNPYSWDLSPIQRHFIQSFNLPDEYVYKLNFPYTECSDSYTPTPVLRASLQNIKLFLASQKPEFREQYQSVVTDFILESEHTILLSGSSGVELLNNLHLTAAVLKRISVFAYGPVSRHRPDCHYVFVQGKQDWYSRLFHSKPDYRVSCGHLNYLETDEVQDICARFIQNVLSKMNLPR